jgi:hypothetical protein
MKTFTKNCCCHRPAETVRVRKAEWKKKRRRGGDMGLFCVRMMEEMLRPGYCVIPYIPLLQPVAPTL